MATIEKWNPYGVAMDITATGGTVTRTSATQYTVVINASWKVSYSGNQTNYGMSAASGGVTKVISSFGTKRGSGSASFTGTYSISGNGAATKTITVTFENYEEDWQGDVTKSASKNVTFNVNVPAWTSYTVSYNANGGTGAPSAQTKWKDQTLTLSSSTPTRTGHTFSKWNTKADGTGTNYNSGANYTSNSNATLYAIWKANTYTVKYNANGGEGAPSNQTKTYGTTLKLSTVVPTKKDYKFLGWATSATASTAQYAAGADYTSNAAVTLYAVWELDYVKPTIYNFTVGRCNSDGTLNDEGTYASVNFSWKCSRKPTSITIYWTVDNVEKSFALSSAFLINSASATNLKIGYGEFSTDKSYQIKVVVVDADGQNEATKTLYSLKVAIDALPRNKGVSFGKTAELEDTADFAYTIYPRAGFIHPIIAAGADLNEQMTPGIYAGENVSTKPYIHSPITSGTFTLEIMSAGPNGQLMQRLTRCDKNIPEVYERWYYGGAWGDWYGGWVYPTLSSKFAMYGTDTTTNQPRYRKIGCMVEVRGIITPTSNITGSTDNHNIFTLPNGYRPNSPIYVLCQGSGTATWMLRVNTDGAVDLSRYRNGDAWATASAPNGSEAGTWLPFQVTYFAK